MGSVGSNLAAGRILQWLLPQGVDVHHLLKPSRFGEEQGREHEEEKGGFVTSLALLSRPAAFEDGAVSVWRRACGSIGGLVRGLADGPREVFGLGG